MAATILGGAVASMAIAGLARTITYLDDSIGEGEQVESVPFSEFRQRVRTGDMLLTSSTEITSMTRMYTQSLWSHIGIACFAPSNNNRLYEWSSHNETENIGNSWGIVCGGPQLVPVENLAAESGTIFWRPMGLKDKQRLGIRDVVQGMAYRSHFSDAAELLVYLGWPFTTIFAGYGGGMACPHVVAATYAAVGALELDRDVSVYTPEMLSDSGDAKWLEPTGRTKMVVGYDSSSLVLLPSAKGFYL